MGKISDEFIKKASKQKRKIAIAIMRPIPETIDSLKKASAFCDITVVGAEVAGFNNIIEPDQDKASIILIKLLKENKVEGIVRGQVKDSYTLDEFHKQFNKEPLPSNRKVCSAVLEKGKYSFVMTTGSIYQGITLEDKKFEVERVVRYMKNDLQVEPKIAIMSSLRPTSKAGKYSLLDEIAKLNQQLAEYLRDQGYETKEYYFEYEMAIWEGANLIVPSMGLVGNAWLRALIYLGDWNLVACPYLDLGVVYEDGSRNEKDFYWHIVHAVSMLNNS